MKTTKQQTARRPVKDQQKQDSTWRTLATRLDLRRQVERKLLARIIQDELGQNLVSLKMELWSLQRDFTAKEHSFQTRATDLLRRANESAETATRISNELYPAILTHLGLVEALEWQSAAFQKKTGIQCQFIPVSRPVRLSDARTAALFQIVQECLVHSANCTRPAEIKVQLNCHQGKLVLVVACRKKTPARKSAPACKVPHLIIEHVRLLGGTVRIQERNGLTITAVIPLRSSKGQTRRKELSPRKGDERK